MGLSRAETKRRRPTNPSALLAAREEALTAKKKTYQELLEDGGKVKANCMIDLSTTSSLLCLQDEVLVEPELEMNQSSYL